MAFGAAPLVQTGSEINPSFEYFGKKFDSPIGKMYDKRFV